MVRRLYRRLLAGWVLVLLGCWSVGAVAIHAFHTSLTQMQYNAKARAFEVSLRVFTDDLELALSKEAGQKVKLEAANQHDAHVENYVKKHFALTDAKGQRKALTYVGKEFEADATWIYLEIPWDGSGKGLQLENSIFTELFSDQVNMVNLSYPSSKRTYLFKADDTIQAVN